MSKIPAWTGFLTAFLSTWAMFRFELLSFFSFSGDSKGNIKTRAVLLSIYVTLLAFIITFLSGVTNVRGQYQVTRQPDTETNTVPASEQYVEPDSGPCTAVAALLHFFLLASFLWNCVYGTQLVVLLRSLHSSLPSHWTMLAQAVGWGKNSLPTKMVVLLARLASDVGSKPLR